jgi:hypothetical protein
MRSECLAGLCQGPEHGPAIAGVDRAKLGAQMLDFALPFSQLAPELLDELGIHRRLRRAVIRGPR